MTAPDPGLDFHARVVALCPSFVADGEPRRFRKSEVLVGRAGELAVLAKRLAKPDPVWAWYFAREVAMYRAFAAEPPGVLVPRLVAAADDVLIVEHLAGEPLARERRPAAMLPIRTIAALLSATDSLTEWPHKPVHVAPSPRVRAQLRERLLEHPDEPTWVRDGIRLAARRGLVPEALGRTVDDALGRYTQTAFGHGDLLLRNAISDDDDTVALVDWECAGIHPRDWDRALLWTQLAPPARGLVEDAVRDSGGRWRAFLGLVVFALARELRFAGSFGPPDKHAAQRDAIATEMMTVAERLA